MADTVPKPHPPASAPKKCGHCGTVRTAVMKLHCTSPTCQWWRCQQCGCMCDPSGRHLSPKPGLQHLYCDAHPTAAAS